MTPICGHFDLKLLESFFADNPRVDYLSLDVEGAELAVLETIPFDRVDIRTLSVEVEHSDSKKIVQLLVRNGYKSIVAPSTT